MKQCLACGGISADREDLCRRCGRRLDHYKPAPAGSTLDVPREATPDDDVLPEEPSVRTPAQESGASVLSVLGILFYVAAAIYVIPVLTALGREEIGVMSYLAAALACLFFGGVCFAAHDIRASLRSIDGKLTRPIK